MEQPVLEIFFHTIEAQGLILVGFNTLKGWVSSIKTVDIHPYLARYDQNQMESIANSLGTAGPARDIVH